MPGLAYYNTISYYVLRVIYFMNKSLQTSRSTYIYANLSYLYIHYVMSHCYAICNML